MKKTLLILSLFLGLQSCNKSNLSDFCGENIEDKSIETGYLIKENKNFYLWFKEKNKPGLTKVAVDEITYDYYSQYNEPHSAVECETKK